MTSLGVAVDTLKKVTTVTLLMDCRSLTWSRVPFSLDHSWVTLSMSSSGSTSVEISTHREVDNGIAKLILLYLPALAVADLIVPYFLFIKCIPVAGDNYMDTQLGHVGRDLGFVADVCLLGRGLDGINDELGVNHLCVGDKCH